MPDTPPNPSDRTRTLADGASIPRLGLGVWQVPNGPECENAVRWALESATATSTRPRPTATRRASGARCATAASRARRSSSRRSSIPAQRPGGRGGAEPAAARRRSGRPLHRALAAGGRPGRGRGWRRPSARGYARSIGVSNFSVRELEQVIGDRHDAARGRPGPVQPVRVPARRCSRRASSATWRSRPTARSGPAGTSRPGRRRDRRARRAHAGAGPPALVHPAPDDRAPEVDPSRADRGERADLRLRAVRRRHGRPRRPRPDRRHREARESRWW